MSSRELKEKNPTSKVLTSDCHFISKADFGFELLELICDDETSPDFIFLEVNHAYEKLTGLKAAELIGKRKRVATPFAEKRWYDNAFQALKTGKNRHYEYQNPLLNKILDTRFIPITSTIISVLFEDVTDKIKTRNDLKESKERLKGYIESTPTAVFVANPEGKYVFVNEGATRLLNYSKEELLTMHIPQVLSDEDMEKGLLQFSLVKKTGKSKSELSLKRKDGSSVCVILTAAKLPDGDLIANCEDITERKELEKQLQSKERLAAIGSTAGMVGHDIRNPLQAIVGEVFLLKDNLAELPAFETKKDVLESLSSIEKNTDYINKIVADLQDYARPLNPEYLVTPLQDIINSSFKTVDLPENVELEVRIHGDITIKTDPTFVQRAITNLVNNAIQAMPQGGKLTVKGTHDQDNVIILVEDTGIGIPQQIRTKLFTPMTTTKAKGQGLGLVVVKRLIEALNGKIYFESQEGKGTKFIINLPNHDQNKRTAPAVENEEWQVIFKNRNLHCL
jgi:two-component system sporulation sensor kinase A